MLREVVFAFVILGTCLVIHIAGIIFVGDQLIRRRQQIQQRLGPVLIATLLTAVFGFVLFLHVTEAVIWALFYKWRGCFATFETCLYFSLKTYSTVGYGDVLLPVNWRLLGTIEAISGVLQCGLSTAFLFSILNALFQFRMVQIRKREDQDVGPYMLKMGRDKP